MKMNSFLLSCWFTLFYYSVYLCAGGIKCAYYSNMDFRFEARELRSRLDLPSITEMQEKLKLPDKLIEYAFQTYLNETGTVYFSDTCTNFNFQVLILSLQFLDTV